MHEDLPAGRERGFTVIEGLVATAILLIVAIGILPLFTNSILNNTRGSDSTTASNFSKTVVENYLQLPFNNVSLTISGGSTVKEVDEWWKPGAGPINDTTQGWQTTAPPATTLSTWTRVTKIQQYGLGDILTNGTLTTPLDGATQPNFVQLKLVTVNAQSSKLSIVTAAGGAHGAPLGDGEAILLQTIKAF